MSLTALNYPVTIHLNVQHNNYLIRLDLQLRVEEPLLTFKLGKLNVIEWAGRPIVEKGEETPGLSRSR